MLNVSIGKNIKNWKKHHSLAFSRALLSCFESKLFIDHATVHELIISAIFCSQVLSLPALVWKQLVGEKVTWTRDYATVDNAEVVDILVITFRKKLLFVDVRNRDHTKRI